MNGAESLIQIALAAGVDTCFANPGTTEMPLVAALDSRPGNARGALPVRRRLHRRRRRVRADVAQACDDAAASRTGTRQRPRESAQRAARQYAGRECDWRSRNLASRRRRAARQRHRFARLADVRMGARDEIRACARDDMADAIAASLTPPGKVATLIVPCDCQWDDAAKVANPRAVPAARESRRQHHRATSRSILKRGESRRRFCSADHALSGRGPQNRRPESRRPRDAS